MLNYVHTGIITIKETTMTDLLKAAHILQVDEVKMACAKLIKTK